MREMWVDIFSFGYWVERRRKALNLTRAELAEQVGCAPVTIKKIERDERRPSLEIAELLADQLYIPAADRDQFLGMARGEYVAPLPSPLEVVPPPPFAQLPRDPPDQEKAPFVARENELATLAATLETARSRSGQITFVIGGAGRGKTMLVREFARKAMAADPELLVVSGNCNAHSGLGDPYLPFREALTILTGEVEAGVAGGLISQQRGQRLWQAMPLTIPALVEQAPDLIDTFVPGAALRRRAAAFAPADTSWLNRLTEVLASQPGEVKQERLFAQYAAVLKTVAARQPLLLIIEDLHWVDASSSSLLFYLSRQLHDSPILIIGTYRPDEVALSRGEGPHPMAGIVGELKRRHGDIWLDLAEVSDSRHFVDAFLDTEPNRLDEGFRQALFVHTGGHALFTVELLREMQERGDLQQDETGYWVVGQTIDWQTLPPKVEGVIEQRINRLEEALRNVLTIASVEGESFTAEVIARIQTLDERQLVQRLSQQLDKQYRLVTAEALERLRQQRLSLYRFRHHLFQHYLYHQLDETERVYLHEEVGLALEALYGDETKQIATQLARHFEQAGLTEKAIEYLHQSGEKALRQSANVEAIDHLTRALELLKTLPATAERARKELVLQVALTGPLITTKGHGAPETVQTFDRARQLAAQTGDTSQVFPLLYGKWVAHIVKAEGQAAREAAEQFLALAKQQPDTGMLMMGYRLSGISLGFIGELQSSRNYLERALALFEPEQHQDLTFRFVQHPGAAIHGFLAWFLWLLGYPDQALRSLEEAISMAREVNHVNTLGYVLTLCAGGLYQYRRDIEELAENVRTVIELAEQQGLALWLALAPVYEGWTKVQRGQPEAGVAQMLKGLTDTQVTGTKLTLTSLWAMLAEGYAALSQTQEGLKVIDEALAQVEDMDERYWEAELHRLKGELLLMQTAEAEAEASFQQAIAIARQQDGKSLELRATVSLARLWQAQGKTEEARQMLAEIYGWFTEGFDTVDLKEAKEFLRELGVKVDEITPVAKRQNPDVTMGSDPQLPDGNLK